MLPEDTDQDEPFLDDLSERLRSAGDLVSGMAQDISRLVRLEIDLAKQEIIELAKPKLMAAALGGIGAVLGLMLVPLVLLTLFKVIDIWMPAWAAALVLTLFTAAACGGLFLFAKSKLDKDFTPRRTIESLKENVAWLKRRTK
jgi:hypothetical protein